MNQQERVQLLFGPYTPPTLKRGDRTFCLVRDCDVTVTGWNNGRIAWPRCRAFGTHGGGSGILVDDELARAIRNESATALRYWWGASITTIWWWRRCLGVKRAGTEGSRRLIRAASEAGADKLRGKLLPAEQVERRRNTARELNLEQHLQPGYHGPWWTEQELLLLGTAPDAEIAARIGRTPNAVRIKRRRLDIPEC